jgi:hypothetical protein
MFIESSIPVKITYAFSNQKKLFKGRNNLLGKILSPQQKNQMITPAFVADYNDPNMINKAVKLANSIFWGAKSIAVTTTTLDNDPIKNLRIISYDTKFSGSPTYKAIANGFCVDLKEEILLEALLNDGVEPGGILKGEFVWARLGSNLKLIKVGSAIYNDIIKYQNKKNLKPLQKNVFEVGGIYQTSRGDKSIFLGLADTTSFSHYIANNFNFKQHCLKKGYIFYNLDDEEDPGSILDENYLKKEIAKCYFKSNHKLIEKIDQIKIDYDVISTVRDAAIKKIKNQLVDYVNRKNITNNSPNIMASYLEYSIVYYSKLLNMYPTNTKAVEPFNIKKYLIFT